MPPRDHSWQDLSWNWAYSTGQPASDQRLEAAAKAAWPYALLCAWTYLNDREAAHDLMDHSVQNVASYISRHPDPSTDKLTYRIKSVIRRRAKQLAARRSHEISYGSLRDLEYIFADQTDVEQKIYANELFERLSPFGQSIVRWRWLGYTWREIAQQLDMDHTAVRRAYFREMESLLQSLSLSGDFSK